LPLLERARVEVFLPDLPTAAYRNLLTALDEEFTHAFGGCTIMRGLDGSYLSEAGVKVRDNINLILSDMPFALTEDFESIAIYTDELRQAVFEALSEEAVFVSVLQVWHTS
jgi:hypothetical protein